MENIGIRQGNLSLSNEHIKRIITPEIFVAYSQCKLKSFSLLFGDKKENHNEYAVVLDEKTRIAKLDYLNEIDKKHPDSRPYSTTEMKRGIHSLVGANLLFGNTQAYADFLRKIKNSSYIQYIPGIIVGSHKINKEHKLWLSFVAYVLSKTQGIRPNYGTVTGGNMRTHRVKIEYLYQKVEQFLRKVKAWETGRTEAPEMFLNRHCPYCQFQRECELEAKKRDHLSQLRGMSEKEIVALNKRGIFTATQLSYTYRPRKSRQVLNSRKYKHALKALAIRNNNIYIVDQQGFNVSGKKYLLMSKEFQIRIFTIL